MKTQIIQSSTRTPVKKKGKRIAKESDPEKHQNSLGLEGDITADHTNTKKKCEAKDITDEEKTDDRNLIAHEKGDTAELGRTENITLGMEKGRNNNQHEQIHGKAGKFEESGTRDSEYNEEHRNGTRLDGDITSGHNGRLHVARKS